MRYIHFTGGNGYCGCDIDEYQTFEDITDEELDTIADEKAMENGEQYEYVCTGWDEEFESEEERDDYYANCSCNWEEISKEEWEENQ